MPNTAPPSSGPSSMALDARGFRLSQPFIHRASLDLSVRGLNGQYTNAVRLDFLNTVRIRDQFSLNAALHYRHRQSRSDLRAEIFNHTDEENFAPVSDGGYLGSTQVLPEPPRSCMPSLSRPAPRSTTTRTARLICRLSRHWWNYAIRRRGRGFNVSEKLRVSQSLGS